MNLPKVTIITVCYNSGKTIEQTILSVLGQTYNNIEYIIVDGGSTDNTLDIVNKYNKKISVISETDEGIYHAMNKGIMKSSGDIIGIINSDDWYEDYAVELAVQYLDEKGCDLVYGRCKNLYGDGTMMEKRSDVLEELRYRMVIWHPTVFVKKRIYEKYGIFNQQYAIAADYDLMLRFYESGVKMVEIPKCIAYFRMSGKSNKEYEKTLIETKEVALKHWDGRSTEMKQKIEKYSDERMAYAKLERVTNKINQNLKKILSEMYSREKGYVIFGAGNYGTKCLSFLKVNGLIVEKFVDNDLKKRGEKCGDIEIEAPDYLKDNYKNVIVANVYFKEEIQKQLEDMGYRYGVDFIFVENIVEKLLN